jgi:decaprenylphospho-beta-D-erythro-pentofuranosid-2-ulose 2-reductase
MQNALGEVQTIVLLGGTSEIGRAIVERLVTPTTSLVVLAGRTPDAIDTAPFEAPGRSVLTAAFDAADTATHQTLVDRLSADHGDLDVVVVAFGQLGDHTVMTEDATAAAALAHVNFTGAVSVMTAVAARFRRQGHGRMVVLSSVAGERVRKANYVYGSTKAGLDGFAQGLGDDLAAYGASVLVVRPGFVHTKMTAGHPVAPMATTPDAVADATVAGLRAGRRTVWAPAPLRYLFMVMRHVPGPIWRRMKR